MRREMLVLRFIFGWDIGGLVVGWWCGDLVVGGRRRFWVIEGGVCGRLYLFYIV